jgi:release factor glutamine methyltransferase
MKLMRRNPLYDPREDSFLLAEAVKVYTYGETLDMGTGSGILAITAANNGKVKEVLAVDINTDALIEAKKRNLHPLITYMQSDLFSNVKGTFDTIIFNPPYLPDDPNLRDIALDGGKKGYEFSVRFLKDARKHLADNGQMLFLFSSLTHKEVIDKTLIENAYLFEEISKQKLDFEILYVYKIKKVESIVSEVKNLKFFSKGKRGLIYTGKFKKTKAAVKIKNPRSEVPGRIHIEGHNLNIVNKLKIGPKLLKASDDYIIYKFVEGTLFPKFLEKSSKKDTLSILKQLFSQMRTLDKNQMNKEEMSNPYKHIIVTKKKKVVLIDFERSNKTLKPHNITQFVQYIVSEKVSRELIKKGIKIDRKEILSLAQEYKKDYELSYYKAILKLIR